MGEAQDFPKGDFLATDSPVPGLERLEARFHGHAYDPHRHETYAIGLTLDGAQGFRYRGEAQVSRAGQIMVLHPDEQHDGHAAVPDGFSYRMIYADPALIGRALDHEGMRTLPFVTDAVTRDRAMMAIINEAFADFPGKLDPLAGDALLAGLADALARRAGQGPRRSPAKPHYALRKVRDFLDAEFARMISNASPISIASAWPELSGAASAQRRTAIWLRAASPPRATSSRVVRRWPKSPAPAASSTRAI
jgi:hypothetical protein